MEPIPMLRQRTSLHLKHVRMWLSFSKPTLLESAKDLTKDNWTGKKFSDGAGWNTAPLLDVNGEPPPSTSHSPSALSNSMVLHRSLSQNSMSYFPKQKESETTQICQKKDGTLYRR